MRDFMRRYDVAYWLMWATIWTILGIAILKGD